jgi:hypothetical protein
MTVLHRYFTKWKLQVNINKTVAIRFTKRRPHPTVTTFSTNRNPLEPTHQVPGPGIRLQTPFYETPEHCHTQGHGRFACTFPPLCSRFYVVFTQQTHSLQIIDSPNTHIRRPCLEQYLEHKLSSSSNSSVEMSPGYRQLPKAHPHSSYTFHS